MRVCHLPFTVPPLCLNTLSTPQPSPPSPTPASGTSHSGLHYNSTEHRSSLAPTLMTDPFMDCFKFTDVDEQALVSSYVPAT